MILRLLISVGLLCLGLWCSTSAQVPMTGAGPGKPATTSYSGPGDVIIGAVAWWGFRGYNAAYSGNCCVICTAADASCETETISNGALVLGTVGQACLLSGTCLVKTIYDQSGALACAGGTACDVTNATAANQPTFAAAVLNGKACAVFDGAHNLVSANSLTESQPLTLSAIAERTANFTSVQGVIGPGNAAGKPLLEFAVTANTITAYAGSLISAIGADSAFHTIIGVLNGASPASSITIDGTTTSGSSGAATLANTLSVGSLQSANYLSGSFCEGGIWPIAFSSTQIANLTNNQNAYWGL
jgi:hypothetical protein